MSDVTINPGDAESPTSRPTRRPQERCWPYLNLPEQPTDEELQALDPDLRRALYATPLGPFSITLVFPRFDGPDYERALELARAAGEFQQRGSGADVQSRARFTPDQALALRDLFEIVGRYDGCEVLVDDHRVPYARELWLPLMWYLLPRS
ncbi:MAG: hypothetical protein GEV06_04280 [Luteitalea sp.]|nr:hypothetical protein [Luteitalea sp.]